MKEKLYNLTPSIGTLAVFMIIASFEGLIERADMRSFGLIAISILILLLSYMGYQIQKGDEEQKRIKKRKHHTHQSRGAF